MLFGIVGVQLQSDNFSNLIWHCVLLEDTSTLYMPRKIVVYHV